MMTATTMRIESSNNNNNNNNEIDNNKDDDSNNIDQQHQKTATKTQNLTSFNGDVYIFCVTERIDVQVCVLVCRDSCKLS